MDVSAASGAFSSALVSFSVDLSVFSVSVAAADSAAGLADSVVAAWVIRREGKLEEHAKWSLITLGVSWGEEVERMN